MDRFVWHLDHLIKKHKIIFSNFLMLDTVFSLLANSQGLLFIKVTADEPLKPEVSHELSLEFHKQIIIDLFEVFDDV
jgi:hypothetical protein